MKHNLKITLLLLLLFLVTQFIGLFVVSQYLPQETPLPYGMEPPEDVAPRSAWDLVISFSIAFAIVVVIMLLLTKYRAEIFLKIWFFVVIVLAIGISVNSLLLKLPNSAILALIISVPLGFFKVFRRNLLVHNLTELLVYPGIASIFVVMLASWTNSPLLAIIVILVLISVYDMYAVWHAGFMQKMAHYQINHLKIFTGFFVPYASRKQKQLLARTKKSQQKTKKLKIGVAILGGGDIVFPIILAGIVLMKFGILQAAVVSLCATLALAGLFHISKKGKFYPAMPFISAGCFVGLLLAWAI